MPEVNHPGIKLLKLGQGLQYVAMVLRQGFDYDESGVEATIEEFRELRSDLRLLVEIAESVPSSELIYNIRVTIEMTRATLGHACFTAELYYMDGDLEKATKSI